MARVSGRFLPSRSADPGVLASGSAPSVGRGRPRGRRAPSGGKGLGKVVPKAPIDLTLPNLPNLARVSGRFPPSGSADPGVLASGSAPSVGRRRPRGPRTSPRQTGPGKGVWRRSIDLTWARPRRPLAPQKIAGLLPETSQTGAYDRGPPSDGPVFDPARSLLPEPNRRSSVLPKPNLGSRKRSPILSGLGT